MGEDSEAVDIPVDQIRIHPALDPKRDENFIQLLMKQMEGTVESHLALVPLALCVPFDLDYRPDLHPIAKALIDQFARAWDNAAPPLLTVYQRGRWFVVSDDYPQLFAAIQVKAPFVACRVLGDFKPDGVVDLDPLLANREK